MRVSAMRAALHVRLGSEARSKEGFRRELQVALGKLARLGCALLMARDAGMLSVETFGELEASRDHAEKLTRGLYLALRKGEKAGGKR